MKKHIYLNTIVVSLCLLSIPSFSLATPDIQIGFTPPTLNAPPIKIGKFHLTVSEFVNGEPKVFFEERDIPFGDCKGCFRGVSLDGKQMINGMGIRLEGPNTKNLKILIKNGSGFKLKMAHQIESKNKFNDFSKKDVFVHLIEGESERFRVRIDFANPK